MKDLLLRALVVVRTSNMKISRRRLADYDKTLHQEACRTWSTIIFLHSTNQIIDNQIIDLWRCCWRCRRQILNSLLFCRGRHRLVHKSVPHVQHDYFSSFNQSNHWFMALSLTLPSSNLKLPIVWTTWAYDDKCSINFVFLCTKRWFQFNSRIVRTHFSSKMNNWKWLQKHEVIFSNDVLASVDVVFA